MIKEKPTLRKGLGEKINKFKKKRILENKKFSDKRNIYEVFENKIVKALFLEREIMIRNFGKIEQYQARIQLIVYLVSCLEYFLGELFKKSVDKNVINLEGNKKLEKIVSLGFNERELLWIKKNKIKLSDILLEELSFQNAKDIFWFGDLLNVVKHFKEIATKKTEKIYFKELIKKKKGRNLTKSATKLIIRAFGTDFALPKKNKDFIKIINTLQKMIYLRHKIVHKTKNYKISNWESLAYSMATVQFAFFIYQSYLIEKSLKTKNSRI